jgi:hypothetical protein
MQPGAQHAGVCVISDAAAAAPGCVHATAHVQQHPGLILNPQVLAAEAAEGQHGSAVGV